MIPKPSKAYIDSLIVIGFKLYPKSTFKFDKTFTSIFGKNGVGKTTLLDAIQVGIIANQQYTKFNVTTHKDDRTLADYMYSTLGYIIFNIGGMTKQYAFGVRLYKQPDGKVEIKPFAAENTHLIIEDFFEGNLLLDDFRNIKLKLLNRSPSSTLFPFDTISEYHNYLFEKGILGLNISSRISDFSLLYRSISTGILHHSSRIIKDVLATADNRPRNLITTLSNNIKQRNIIQQKIREIKNIKENVEHLFELKNRYTDISYKYFCTQYGNLNSQLNLLFNKNSNIEKQLNIIDDDLKKILLDITKKDSEYKELEKEIQLLLENISDMEKNFRAFEEYSETKVKITKLTEELNNLKHELEQHTYKRDEYIKRADELIEAELNLSDKKSALYYELQGIKEHLSKYQQLVKHIQNFEKATLKKLTQKNITDELEFWNDMSDKIKNLSLYQNRFHNIHTQYKQYLKAKELYENLIGKGISFSDIFNLEGKISEFEQKIYNYKKEIERSSNQKIDLQKEIETLITGKIELPDTLKNYHGKLLYKFYDNIPLEESKELEAILGELKTAAVFDDEEEIERYLKGSKRLHFIKNSMIDHLKRDCIKKGEGYLIKESEGLLRYEPESKYPVLGESSRKERIKMLKNEIELIDQQIANFQNELSNSESLKSTMLELKNLYEFLEKKDLEEQYHTAQQEVEFIESHIPIFNKIKNDIPNISKLMQYFGREDYEIRYKEVDEEHKKVIDELKAITNKKSQIKKDIENMEAEIGSINQKISQVSNELNRSSGKKEHLEQNYPSAILNGEIDFTEIEQLQKKKHQMYLQKDELQKYIDHLKDKKRELESEQIHLSRELNRNLDQIKHLEQSLEETKSIFTSLFKHKEIEPFNYGTTNEEYFKSKALFEEALKAFLAKNNKSEPITTDIEEKYQESITKVCPNFNSLTKLSDELTELERKLNEIESDIKEAIAGFTTNIEQRISDIRGKLKSINTDLKVIKFGRIRQIRIVIRERDAYFKLQHIHQTNSILNFLESENVDFESFIKELAKNLGYTKGNVSDEDILDYRNYFDIDIELYDEKMEKRTKGLSNGENLGTNILIVLAILTRFTEGSISNKALPILLDEADRLDSDSINTLYDIAEQWGLQMIVALPNIPNFNKGLHYQLIAQENGIVAIHTRFAS